MLLFIIIATELIFIISLLIRNYNIDNLINKIDNFFSIKSKNKFINIESSLINLIILLLFVIYFFYALKNLGQPVSSGDPLDMWNRWALSWSKNEIPIGVEYPQAVPILYSISYVLMSNFEIEYFTSAVCLIYPIWIFVIFFRLIYLFPENKTLIKLSLILTTFFLLSILRNYSLFVGYSDPILVLVTTSTIFVFIYYFFKKQDEHDNEMNFKDIMLVSLIAVTPAITKQMGLLISFVFPVFFLIIQHSQKKKFVKNLFLISLIIFIISFSWYIFPIYEYSQINFDSSSTKFGKLSSSAMSEYQHMSLIQKLNHGLDYLFWEFKYLICLLILLSLNNKYSLSILFLIVLPYFCIWSLFFVVDNRNFVMVSPFLGFILSIGLINLFKVFSLFNSKFFKTSKIILIFIFTFLFAFSLQKIKQDDKLINKSIEAKKLRGFSETNILLYNYLKNSNPDNNIINVSDRIFTYLPYIGDRFVRVSCQQFMNLIDKDYKNRDYYLLLNKDYCELNNLYQSGLDQLNIEKLFEHKKHQFFLIIN